MAPASRNLVNLKDVEKGYGSRSVLGGITLGINAGDRIGVVGRNGDGKSTLLKLIGGREEPDAGAVTRLGGLHADMISQGDELDGTRTIRDELVGGRADHEWAADKTFRSVLDGLLTPDGAFGTSMGTGGGVRFSRFPQGLDTTIGPLSGGERRRIALAKLLLDGPELLLLDEPTNHLDVEGVAWLARFLAARRGSLVVVTHDRWFLDEVATQTWEVADGQIHQYEGGYAAYVLARTERERQAASQDARRQQLLRKELAWLRRGPPARTSKPKFRIEAANALIADEPEPRDTVELLRFAGARLGDKVLDAEGVSVTYGERELLGGVTWRLGPGERVALVGVNGAGKTTLVKLLSGDLEPTRGKVTRGQTVRLAHLSQDTAEVPGHLRVLESLELLRGRTKLADGTELTAGSLCDRFGFRGPKARTLVKDLSGGERRRLQLMRLLMDEPNVLLLDEPTNDLDIDTLTALEDLLDAFAGTIVVVSHDRYFVERVCDDVYGLMGESTAGPSSIGGGLRHLPGGIGQYVELRAGAEDDAPVAVSAEPSGAAGPPASQAELRAARKELARLERSLEKLAAREATLHEDMAAAATDHAALRELQGSLTQLAGQRGELEVAWMAAAEQLET